MVRLSHAFALFSLLSLAVADTTQLAWNTPLLAVFTDATIQTFAVPMAYPDMSTANVNGTFSISCTWCGSGNHFSVDLTAFPVLDDFLSTSQWPLWTTVDPLIHTAGLVGMKLYANVTDSSFTTSDYLRSALNVSYTLSSSSAITLNAATQWMHLPPSYWSSQNEYLGRLSLSSPVVNADNTLSTAVTMLNTNASFLAFSSGLITLVVPPTSNPGDYYVSMDNGTDFTLIGLGYNSATTFFNIHFTLGNNVTMMQISNIMSGRVRFSVMTDSATMNKLACQGLIALSPVINFAGSFWSLGTNGSPYGQLKYLNPNIVPYPLTNPDVLNGTGSTDGAPFWPWFWLNQTTGSWVDAAVGSSYPLGASGCSSQAGTNACLYLYTTYSTEWAILARNKSYDVVAAASHPECASEHLVIPSSSSSSSSTGVDSSSSSHVDSLSSSSSGVDSSSSHVDSSSSSSHVDSSSSSSLAQADSSSSHVDSSSSSAMGSSSHVDSSSSSSSSSSSPVVASSSAMSSSSHVDSSSSSSAAASSSSAMSSSSVDNGVHNDSSSAAAVSSSSTAPSMSSSAAMSSSSSSSMSVGNSSMSSSSSDISMSSVAASSSSSTGAANISSSSSPAVSSSTAPAMSSSSSANNNVSMSSSSVASSSAMASSSTVDMHVNASSSSTAASMSSSGVMSSSSSVTNGTMSSSSVVPSSSSTGAAAVSSSSSPMMSSSSMSVGNGTVSSSSASVDSSSSSAMASVSSSSASVDSSSSSAMASMSSSSVNSNVSVSSSPVASSSAMASSSAAPSSSTADMHMNASSSSTAAAMSSSGVMSSSSSMSVGNGTMPSSSVAPSSSSTGVANVSSSSASVASSTGAPAMSSSSAVNTNVSMSSSSSMSVGNNTMSSSSMSVGNGTESSSSSTGVANVSSSSASVASSTGAPAMSSSSAMNTNVSMSSSTGANNNVSKSSSSMTIVQSSSSTGMAPSSSTSSPSSSSVPVPSSSSAAPMMPSSSTGSMMGQSSSPFVSSSTGAANPTPVPFSYNLTFDGPALATANYFWAPAVRDITGSVRCGAAVFRGSLPTSTSDYLDLNDAVDTNNNVLPTFDTRSFGLTISFNALFSTDGSSQSFEQLIDCGSSPSVNEISLGRSGNSQGLVFRDMQGVTGLSLLAAASIPVNRWTHYAVTFTNQSAVVIYVNGKVVAQGGNFPQQPSAGRMMCYLGRSLGERTGDLRLKGAIDSFSLITRALGAYEISSMYTMAQNTVCSNVNASDIFAFPGVSTCPAGSYINEGLCALCPVGTYSMGGNVTSCAMCPPRSYSAVLGASRCSTCPSGFLAVNASCQACDVDTFFNSTSYTCQACDAGFGTSGRLAQSTCLVTLAVPTDATVSAITATTFNITWSYPLNSSNAQFVIQLQNTLFATSSFTTAISSIPVVLSSNSTYNVFVAQVRSLSALTTYTTNVISATGLARSMPSMSVMVVTSAVAPAAPSSLTLLASNITSIAVTWTPVVPISTMSDASIAYYTVRVMSGNTVAAVVNTTQTTYTFTSLASGTTFNVQVQAVIVAGLASVWAPAAPLVVATPAPAPAALTGSTCTVLTSTSCFMTFQGTLVPSAQQIVTLFNSTGASVRTAALTTATASRGYLFTGLKPGTAYISNVIQIVARAGSSPSVSTPFTTLLQAPKIVSLVAGGNVGWISGATLTVTFDVDTNMGNISVASTGSVRSMLTFMPALADAANINGQWVNARTLLLTFASISGTQPQAGVLTVSMNAGSNVQAVGPQGSDISTATSPPMTGSFGQLSPVLLVSGTSISVSAGVVPFQYILNNGWLNINSTQVAILAAAGNTQFRLTLVSTAGMVSNSSVMLSTANFVSTLGSLSLTVPDLFMGPLSLVMTLSLPNNAVVDNGALTFSVQSFNHPPTVSINSSFVPMLYSEQAGALPMFIIDDVDVALYPSAILRIQLGLDMGSVNFTSVPANVVQSGNQLMGTLADLKTALQALTVTLPLSSRNSTLLMTLNDLGNGGAPTAYTASYALSIGSDCSMLAAPVISSAVFSNDGSQLIVTFDRTFTLSTTGTSVTPLSVFSAAAIASFGNGATAVQSGSTQIIVQLGISPSVALGSPINVAGNMVSRCPSGLYFASSSVSVPVQAPLNPVVPVVTVNGPSVVSSCDSVTLNTISSGLAGRAGVFSWSGNNNMFDPTVMYGNNVVLPGGTLLPSATYTASVTVTNFLGVSSQPAVISFNVSSLPLPLLAIQGPQVAVLYLYQLPSVYTLRSTVMLSECWSAGNQQLAFQWTDTFGNASAPLAAAASTMASSLSLPTNMFVTGMMYTFTLTATAVSDPLLTVSASVSLYFAVPPLELAAVTSSSLSIASLSSIAMAVSLQDPSINSIAMFHWSAETADEGVCFDMTTSNPLDLTMFNNTRAMVAGDVLEPNQYVFSVYASYGSLAAGNLVVSNVVEFGVLVSADPIPSVELSILAPMSASVFRKVLHDSSVALTANAALPDGTPLLSTDPAVTFVWLLDGPDTDMLSTAEATTEASSTLILNQERASGFFQQGASYAYTVFVFYYDEEAGALLTTSASVTLATGTSPSQGQLMVTPNHGVSLNTTFSLRAVDWVGQTDLSYAFYTYQVDANGVQQQSMLSPFSPSPSVTLSYLVAGNLTLGVLVRDLFNATASYEVNGVVITMPVFGSGRRLLSAQADLDSLIDTMNRGVADAANTLDGPKIMSLLTVVNQQLQSIAASSNDSSILAAVKNTATSMIVTVQRYAEYASPAQVISTLSAITSNAMTMSASNSADIASLINDLQKSAASLTVGDFASLADISYSALSSSNAEMDGANVELTLDSLSSTLTAVQQNVFVGDGSVWSRSTFGTSGYMMRFDAVTRNGTAVTPSNSTVTVIPHFLAANQAVLNAKSMGQSLLLDARVLMLTVPSTMVSSILKTVSSGVRVDITDVNGLGSAVVDSVDIMVQSIIDSGACVTTPLTATTQLACQLVCAQYDQMGSIFAADSFTVVPGCTVRSTNNGDGTSTASYTAPQSGYYVVAAQYSTVSNVTSSSSSSSTGAANNMSSSVSSSSTGVSGNMTSSTGNNNNSSMSSSSTGSQSSSSSAPATRKGSVRVTMTATFGYAVNASNYRNVSKSFERDIATNLARALNSTADILAPYVSVTSIGAFSTTTSRRLLSDDLAVSFVILGSISDVVSTTNVTDVSQVGQFVANTLINQVTSGSFFATNAGATVPSAQVISVINIDTSSSSSSTGMLNDDDASGSNNSARDIGLGIGLGLALPLVVLAIVVGCMYAKRNGRSRAEVSPRITTVQAKETYAVQQDVVKVHYDNGAQHV